MRKTNIVLIPADNRPVSYALPQNIGSLNKNIQIFMPPKKLLGGLKNNADIEKILEWLEKTISGNEINFILCALDTIAYGGLIPSRRCEDRQDIILSRINSFKQAVNEIKTYAFSSIMRISDSNVNEEEKPYWDEYGKLLYKYSYLLHKCGSTQKVQETASKIPAEILEDYLHTREKNFQVNKNYLQEDFWDFLIYAKDDTAPFGLNIQEAGEIETEIQSKGLEKQAVLKTGCDEMMLILLMRAITARYKIKVFPVYSTPAGERVVPRYEDKPLFESVSKLLKTCGLYQATSQEEADMFLFLHTPLLAQNDFALGEFPEEDSQESVDFCINFIENSDKPVILADVFAANGASPVLAERLLDVTSRLYGYAAWNTASNSIGTALAAGILRYIAEKENAFSAENFNEILFIRFLDDWAYQSIVRQKIRAVAGDEKLLDEEMQPWIARLAPLFNAGTCEITSSFPWDRSFEAEFH